MGVTILAGGPAGKIARCQGIKWSLKATPQKDFKLPFLRGLPELLPQRLGEY